MKTPPFLLGAAVLFWGWQTELLVPAAIMAGVLESPRFVRARWEFSDDDLSRIWTFCAVLFLAVIVYAFTANDGVNSLAGLFQNPNLSAQRRVGDTSARTAVTMIRWLPMVVFLFMAAQSFNTREKISLATISLIFRRRLRKARERGEPLPPLHEVNLSYPYFAMCLFAACAKTTQRETFFAGFSALMIWALWPHRSRRHGAAVWAGALVASLALGYGAQLGVAQLQRLIDNYNAHWFTGFGHRGSDPERTRTALGQIGKLKLSGQIVIRLKTPEAQRPPALLREASYREFAGQAWLAGGADGEFRYLSADTNGTSWNLLPGKTNTTSVNIACALPGQRALLPLPTGSSRLDHLQDFLILSQNDNGAVLAENAGLVIFDARYGPGKTIDAAPNTNEDLQVPEQEKPALVRVMKELQLNGDSPRGKLLAVGTLFESKFSYSLWQPRPRLTSTNETPLSRFLLKTRSGHCEYFATATVLLLRQLGIPARYAVGYAVHEGSGNHYVVRQRDAHAWCLVWNQDSATWEDFDTTPASWIEEESKRASMFQWLSDGWSRIKFEIAKVRWGQTNLRRYLLSALIPVLGFLLYRIVFSRRQRRRQKSGAGTARHEPWPGLDSEFYLVERKLEDMGFERRAGEPVTRWLERITEAGETAGLRDVLRTLSRQHYRLRFDPLGLSAERRNALREQVRSCLTDLERLGSEKHA